MDHYQQQLEAEYNRLLKEERDNMRRKRNSYRAAICLFACISLGLGAALIYGLKERVDVRELRKDADKQEATLTHQQQITEEREYQLSQRDASMEELKQQVIDYQMQCEDLKRKIERGVAPTEYVVACEDSTLTATRTYYRRDGQWVATDATYPNGYEVFVYTRIGQYAMTDYGFIPYYNLEKK